MIPTISQNLWTAFQDLKFAFSLHRVRVHLQYIEDLQELIFLNTYVQSHRHDPPSARRCFYCLTVVDEIREEFIIARCCTVRGPDDPVSTFHHLLREQIQYLLWQIRQD